MKSRDSVGISITGVDLTLGSHQSLSQYISGKQSKRQKRSFRTVRTLQTPVIVLIADLMSQLQQLYYYMYWCITFGIDWANAMTLSYAFLCTVMLVIHTDTAHTVQLFYNFLLHFEFSFIRAFVKQKVSANVSKHVII